MAALSSYLGQQREIVHDGQIQSRPKKRHPSHRTTGQDTESQGL